MSARAGRHGKHGSRTVTETAKRAILCGYLAPLNSAFHITYLIRVEEINHKYLIKKSKDHTEMGLRKFGLIKVR